MSRISASLWLHWQKPLGLDLMGWVEKVDPSAGPFDLCVTGCGEDCDTSYTYGETYTVKNEVGYAHQICSTPMV